MNDRCPLCLGGSPHASHVLFQVLPGVTERLRYSLPTHLLCSQYILIYKLCKGVYSQVFRAIFQVLAGETEGLKYSLPTGAVWPQCYNSYELCLGGSHQVFLVLFQVLAGLTEGLKYSPQATLCDSNCIIANSCVWVVLPQSF